MSVVDEASAWLSKKIGAIGDTLQFLRVTLDPDQIPLATQDQGDLDAAFFENTEDSDKTTPTVIIDETIGVGKLYKINAVVCTTSVEGTCRIFIDALEIGVIRVGAGNKNGRFDWVPSRDILAGEVLTVTFLAASNNGKDVDIFVQGRLLDA